jgi:hypothetical protein
MAAVVLLAAAEVAAAVDSLVLHVQPAVEAGMALS